MINRLEGCKALVVGCNSEIAAAITQELANQNASHIVGTYLEGSQHTGAGIEEVRRRLSALTQFTSMPLDQRNFEQVRQVVLDATEAMGGLDVLVAAASRQSEGDILHMPDEEFIQQISVNLTGAMYLIREAAKQMMVQSEQEPRHRSIVAIASIRGLHPYLQHPYDLAKSGILHFVEGFAKVIGPKGISINAIAPGTVDVALEPVRHQCSPEEYRAQWKPLTPFGGTPVTPEIVAEETVQLLNSGGSTGTVRIVDGGFHTMRPLPNRADK